MELASSTRIPDGLMAAMSQLDGNSRLGLRTSEYTLHPGFTATQSSTALRDSWTVASETYRMSLSCGFGGPSFHGSLHPRPAGTGNPQWDGNFGESLGISTKIRMGSWGIAQALGLPDAECEFGACGPQPSYATGNVGASVNYTLPFGLSGTLFAGFLCDTHLHCGFYWGGGGGAAVGAGASGGVQVGYSNGNTICAFGGPFNNYSGTFGAEAAGTADYFSGAGDAPGGTVRGGGLTVGVGGGGSASAYHTVTSIHPLGKHSCNAAGIIQ
jgi:hypothetical protein